MSNLGERVILWAQREPSVRVLALVGSRAFQPRLRASSDEWSDWDFQVVTSRPRILESDHWLSTAGLSQPLAYVVRVGRLGHSPKVSAVLNDGDLDLVLISEQRLLILRWLIAARLVERVPSARQALFDFTRVLSQGYSFVKGSSAWKRFFERMSSCGFAGQFDDETIHVLAEGYVCDFVSTWQKLQRGEFLAAQRWIHVNLGEVNFRLYYELRRRQGDPAFADGRRIESASSMDWIECLSIRVVPERQSLREGLVRSRSTFLKLIHMLLGSSWRWPDLSSRGISMKDDWSLHYGPTL